MCIAKPITTSLSPNTEKDDILLAFRLIFQPCKWKKGRAIKELENQFEEYLGTQYAFSFNSGRSALLAILDAMDIKKGDEVLLQGFTCNAAVNPILARGAKPVFVDIDDTINMDPSDLADKITSRSRAIIIQHSFGWPAQVDKISKIAKQNNLYLIEDVAHALGAKYQGKFCGTFGDAAFFSFGRDKIISSVFGGMAITNNENLAKKIREFQERALFPSNFWIFQQLLHPILVNCLILPAYGLHRNLGIIMFGIFHKTSILPKAVSKEEKRGKVSKYFPKKMPMALAILAVNQLKKLKIFNEHRRMLADFYRKELEKTGFILPFNKLLEDRAPIFMRYPVLITNINTDKILTESRKKKIYLNDGWRKTPVVPPDTDINKMKYQWGSCPKAEKIAKTIINLPTHINISKKQARKIVDFLLL